jgi:hypothetical protein
MTEPRIERARGLAARAGAVAAVALGLTAAGAALDARRAIAAYHTAFTFWAGIAAASLILLGAFHAARARWMVVLRRVLEAMATTSALFVVLFVPVALFAAHLFPWLDPGSLDPELQRLAVHRRPFLNLPFFAVRGFGYLAAWALVSHLLWRWSVRQDAEKGVALTARQRRLGTGALPLLAVTMTFAAIDWQESLDLHHSSTIFGVYWFAGSFLSAVAVLILALYALRRQELGRLLGADHWHSLGKFLLAFTAFWAYIAFSQYMLIWIANLPAETPFFVHRTHGGWRAVGIVLALFHFAVPFLILLSRDLKRDPRRLAALAGWQLALHYVDVYFTMRPPDQPGGPAPHWTDLSALVGVGAAAVAFAAWRLRGAAAVPVGDPYLEDSLRYQPQ